MRKLSVLLLLAVFTQACTMNDIFFLPTQIPTATAVDTLTPIATLGPTNTPTPLPSPTIVRFPTLDPNQPTPTFEAIPFYRADDASSPVPFPTPEGPGAGFEDVTVSDSRLYWGGCKFNKLTISATVDDPEEVISVIIFTRVKSLSEEDYTPWTKGNVMYNNGDGLFTHRMVGSEVPGHNHYLRSWVYFQLVATDIKGEEIGRSRVFTDKIMLSPCLCLDPSTGCPPTAIPRPTKTPTK